MREIKFRAWDTKDKRMIIHEQKFIPLKVTHFGVLRLNPHNEANYWEIVSDRDFKIMQFTGLKDNAGKEIYEGDILNDGGSVNRTVVFKFGCFYLENGVAMSHLHRQTIDYELDIIGNIYEPLI